MPKRAMGEYTPTEQRILRILMDGKEHTREELVKCIDDELAGPKTLGTHITYLRRKLENKGKTISFKRVSNTRLYQVCQVICRGRS